MSFDSLKGKVIAVTGGASGIGLGIVKKLIQVGAKVAIADLTKEAPKELGQTAKIDADYTYTSLDVSSRQAVHEWVEATVTCFGRLDGMVANAGIAHGEHPIASDEVLQRTLAVNIVGVWNCATEAYYQFRKQDSPGVIVSTSSTNGLKATPFTAAYTASKHAVIGLTKAWAQDWSRYGIRVNAVAPGIVETPLQKTVDLDPSVFDWVMDRTPIGRIGKTHELADSYLFLLADTATFITGTILTCDGGLST